MSSKTFLIVFFIATVVVPAVATEYVVGDNAGWKLNFDYQKWAEGKQFFIGDKLVFKYKEGTHDVHRVNGTGFQQCKAPVDSEGLTSGYDVIELTTPGRKWYTCGIGKHCENVMKLAITVKSLEGQALVPAPTPASAVNKISTLKSCVWTLLVSMAVLMVA